MFRRPLVLAAALTAVATLATPALALDVRVRVEGARTTIFGAADPVLTPFTGNVAASDGSVHPLSQPTALGALERASRKGDFFYRIRAFSFGLFVDQIGRRPGAGSTGWVYKVNGVQPPVGAENFVLDDGDRVLWYWADFSTGSPATLDLVRSRGRCFRAFALDDDGARTAARDVRFILDGRVAPRASGRICPPDHWHTLRATKPGAIRSELVRG